MITTIAVVVSRLSQFANTSSNNGAGVVVAVVASTKPAIMTFDDGGYRSQFTSAEPILDYYGYRASFFFIVCNSRRKNSRGNDFEFYDYFWKMVEQISRQDITTLYKHGHQIRARTIEDMIEEETHTCWPVL
jgi:peptidoglycan/xylan/chitin deacetylase (PgdA/CDA1 family)